MDMSLSMGKQVSNKNIKFPCYEKFSHLGCGNRMMLPCVEKAIKEQFPEKME
jgi:hypothetical protein